MGASPPHHLRLAAGDEQPFDSRDLDDLFRRFSPVVARVASRLLGHQDTDDLVQDVFLDAVSGLRSLRDAGAARQWLVAIAVRKARRRLRRRYFLERLGFGADIDVSSVLDASASAETHAWAATVYRILDNLNVDARVAWVLHRVEDEPLERVAELCGCSRATAHRRVREAESTFELELGNATTR